MKAKAVKACSTERLIFLGHSLCLTGVVCISLGRLIKQTGNLPETALFTAETFNLVLDDLEQRAREVDMNRSI